MENNRRVDCMRYWNKWEIQNSEIQKIRRYHIIKPPSLLKAVVKGFMSVFCYFISVSFFVITKLFPAASVAIIL